MLKKFSDSLKEFKNIKTLCVLGMLGGLSIILSSFAIPVGGNLKIGFSSECNYLVDCLFGPVAGSIFGAGMDVLKYFIKPDGPFFWGWTFNAGLAGIIVGIGLYKKKITFWRVCIVRLINSLIVNVIFGTMWLNMMNGKGFMALLPMRLFKNIVMIPLEALIFVIVYNALKDSGAISMIRQPFGQKSEESKDAKSVIRTLVTSFCLLASIILSCFTFSFKQQIDTLKDAKKEMTTQITEMSEELDAIKAALAENGIELPEEVPEETDSK